VNKYTLYPKLLITFGGIVALFNMANTAHAMDLSTTVEDAILHNPEFREQLKIHQAVQADLRGAEGSWYPTIDLNAGIGLEETDRANRADTSLTRTEASLRLTENIFEGYATVNEISRQKARLDAAGYNAQASANQIAIDMTSAYIELVKQQDSMKLARESKATHERILDQIQQRTEAGIGNQVEVDQAKARLALSNSNLIVTRNNYIDARTRFQRVLGRMPETQLIKPNMQFQFPDTLEEAINIALSDHPTLRSANADIAEARAQHASAASAYYPRIDLELQKTLDNNTNGLEGKDHNLQAMLRLRYNLYNGGKDTARRDVTASEIQQATEIRNNSRRQSIENLTYAWAAKEYLEEQMIYVNQHIQLTYATLEGYRKQFNLGRRSLLDLLNTENEYISALLTRIETESELNTAQYRTLNAMGKLIEALNINIDYALVEHDYSQE